MDKESTCATCETVSKFENLADRFTSSLADALSGPMNLLFIALLGLWVVIAGFKLLMRPSALPDIIQEFFFIFIASVLMAGQGTEGLIAKVYTAAQSVMAGAAETAFTIVPGGQSLTNDQEGMARLVNTIENVVLTQIWTATKAILSSGSALNPINWLYAIIFIVPYFLMMAMYFGQVVVAMFRVLLVAIFAPFLLMTFAFNWGRPMAISGVKTMVSSIMVLFAATSAVSIILFGLQSTIGDGGIDNTGDFARLDNKQFLMILLLGIMGTALMTEAVGIANSITGSMLSNTAAGMITAGLGGSAIAAANQARSRITTAAAPGIGHLGKAFSKMNPAVSEMVAAYKSGSRK